MECVHDDPNTVGCIVQPCRDECQRGALATHERDCRVHLTDLQRSTTHTSRVVNVGIVSSVMRTVSFIRYT